MSKLGKFAVCCPLSCITLNLFFVIYKKKVYNKQQKLESCCIYNVVGIMYHVIIKCFLLFKTLKICFKWKSLSRIKSDMSSDNIGFKISWIKTNHRFLYQKHNAICLQYPRNDLDSKLRYLTSDVGRQVGCCAGQSNDKHK